MGLFPGGPECLNNQSQRWVARWMGNEADMFMFNPTMHLPSFQDAIEFEASVFINWRECI